MAWTEFDLKNKHGVAFWLEDRPGADSYSTGNVINGENQVTVDSLFQATQTVCKRCPLLTTCRPKYQMKKWLKTSVGIYIGGNELTSGKCLLLNQGLSLTDLRPYLSPIRIW